MKRDWKSEWDFSCTFHFQALTLSEFSLGSMKSWWECWAAIWWVFIPKITVSTLWIVVKDCLDVNWTARKWLSNWVVEWFKSKLYQLVFPMRDLKIWLYQLQEFTLKMSRYQTFVLNFPPIFPARLALLIKKTKPWKSSYFLRISFL